ncbi:MAG TPA: HYR domain-containing protein, partial [Actinomycetota bacterium]|nr:HYR domain-containing protein [Actinomycetota bacterium]
CPSPVPSLEGGSYSVVTLRAPTTPGNGYAFTVLWARTLEPAGASDSGALGASTTLVSFTMNVVNIAPTITVPADFTVEGDTPGGWTADWSTVGATDPEDAPDPLPTCTPADGSTLPLGTNAVACSVTDLGGLTATAGFDVTVVDTTAPVLAGVPADATIITDDPAGAVLAYAAPTATDVVDAAPDVDCAPASGAQVRIGTTTVSCTATDAIGNSTSDTFGVTVTYVSPHTATAIWHEPVDAAGSMLSANRGRNLPIKVRLFVDDIELTTGSPSLAVTRCDGGTGPDLALTFGGGRWNASLDTSTLAGSCHTVTAWVDGLRAGTFSLDLRGVEPVRAKAGKR